MTMATCSIPCWYCAQTGQDVPATAVVVEWCLPGDEPEATALACADCVAMVLTDGGKVSR